MCHFILANNLPAPSQLHMTHYSNTCLLLEWLHEAATPISKATPTTLGFRVYVNGIAEGQVFLMESIKNIPLRINFVAF